jgi:hypothetical protein
MLEGRIFAIFHGKYLSGKNILPSISLIRQVYYYQNISRFSDMPLAGTDPVLYSGVEMGFDLDLLSTRVPILGKPRSQATG